MDMPVLASMFHLETHIVFGIHIDVGLALSNAVFEQIIVSLHTCIIHKKQTKCFI